MDVIRQWLLASTGEILLMTNPFLLFLLVVFMVVLGLVAYRSKRDRLRSVPRLVHLDHLVVRTGAWDSSGADQIAGRAVKRTPDWLPKSTRALSSFGVKV